MPWEGGGGGYNQLLLVTSAFSDVATRFTKTKLFVWQTFYRNNARVKVELEKYPLNFFPLHTIRVFTRI